MAAASSQDDARPLVPDQGHVFLVERADNQDYLLGSRWTGEVREVDGRRLSFSARVGIPVGQFLVNQLCL